MDLTADSRKVEGPVKSTAEAARSGGESFERDDALSRQKINKDGLLQQEKTFFI